ncbi:type II toxin-antitoxin system RatA family toxin [Agaribacterium sp. ZY112]|uniref:type II toxin-antitoxin system RatA family toxin n=1 Tax=Agaribacterium sp. ZY112 TaxID=3233574 RepID=UPI003523913A
MSTIERSALVNFSCKQMFDLVNDFEAYPQFMPGCVAAELLGQGENWLEARLHLSRMGVKQSFATRNILNAPHSMTISLLEGPFQRFEGEWLFQALGENACKVIFRLDFDVKKGLAALALPKLMQASASEQVDALCRRAKQVYLN